MFNTVTRKFADWKQQPSEMWGKVWQPGKRGLLIRHSIVLAVLLLTGLGVFGGSLIKTFAFADCAAPDQTYRVVLGDTLGVIANRYKSTVSTLATHNGISNPDLILVGQRICIPGKGQTKPTTSKAGFTAPAGRAQYVAMARTAAQRAKINPDIFVRQINQESGFNPNARSWAGAIGIAQFMPATARSMGVNPYDPANALDGAARLMAIHLKQFGGDYAKALAAYNAGPGAVQRAVNLGGGNWRAYLPAETRNYIRVILG